jgi:hypothetical protein
VTSEGDRHIAMLRHHLSATVKRLFGRKPEQPYA